MYLILRSAFDEESLRHEISGEKFDTVYFDNGVVDQKKMVFALEKLMYATWFSSLCVAIDYELCVIQLQTAFFVVHP